MNWNEDSQAFALLAREQQLAVVYQNSLENIKVNLGKLYAKHDALTYSEVIKYNRLQKIEQDLIAELKTLGVTAKRVTRKALKEGLEQSYYFTGFAIENHTGINMGFTKLPTDIIEAALEDPYDWPTRMDTNTIQLKNRLKGTIVSGLVQGSSYPKMVTALTSSMSIGMRQAKRLLRTEVHRAQVKGRLLGLEKTEKATKRMGIKTQRVWLSARDSRTRDTHVTMMGKPANKNNMFVLPSGAKTRGPGLSGIASEDINCRCSIIMRFPDYEPDIENSKAMEAGKGYSCLLK